MALEHVIPELDRRGLRQFGLLTGGIVAGLFGMLLPWLFERAWPVWPWVVLVVLGGLGLAAPRLLRPVYKAWMRFGLLASRITTPLILGAVFFAVISPMALARRVLGHDSMGRAFEKDAASYRVQSRRTPLRNLERPF